VSDFDRFAPQIVMFKGLSGRRARLPNPLPV
jgi:hypothetical protein